MMQDRHDSQNKMPVCPRYTEDKTMIKKIAMCAVIALIFVPASVLAEGFGAQNSVDQGPGQEHGSCQPDGQSCANQTGSQASCTQAQYRSGTPGSETSGGMGMSCSGDCQSTGDRKHTRTMFRLHDGSGCASGNTP